MTENVTIACIAAGGAIIGIAPATILAWASLRTSKANSIKADDNAAKVDAVAGKVDAVAVKTDAVSEKADAVAVKADTLLGKTTEIKLQTDGHLTEMAKQLAEANARVASMEKLVGQVSQLVQGNQVARAARAKKKN